MWYDCLCYINDKLLPSNLLYKAQQISNLNVSHLVVAVVQSIEARCEADNEDVVGVAPTGDAPITSEWSTILLATKVQLMLEVSQYFIPLLTLTISVRTLIRYDDIWVFGSRKPTC